MKKELEIEYKVLVNEKQLNKIIDIIGYDDEIIQTNYYFDTVNRDLKTNHFSLRIRKVHNVFEYTLKTPSHFEGSIEHNFVCDVFDPSLFSKYDEILSNVNINHKDLLEIGKLKTIRKTKTVNEGLWCFDINFYRDIIDYEIEFEVKNTKFKSYFKSTLLNNNINFSFNHIGKNARATKKA